MSTLDISCARVRDLLDDGGPAPGEHRALVDRLWPRGVRKDRLALTEWAKDVAPSTELRRAFHHDELSFEQFSAQYREELTASGEAEALAERARNAGADHLVLVYAARDPERNHARVLATHLTSRA